jgi:peroxiredoxin
VHLRAFQLARSHIRTLGASVVLISPQRAEYAQVLVDTHTLLFPLLSDIGNQVARQYRLVFQMPPELREEYLASGVNLAEINGDESWEIPMPATFVIDRGGVIQYASVSADYTQRSDPADVLAALRRMRGRH